MDANRVRRDGRVRRRGDALGTVDAFRGDDLLRRVRSLDDATLDLLYDTLTRESERKNEPSRRSRENASLAAYVAEAFLGPNARVATSR